MVSLYLAHKRQELTGQAKEAIKQRKRVAKWEGKRGVGVLGAVMDGSLPDNNEAIIHPNNRFIFMNQAR